MKTIIFYAPLGKDTPIDKIGGAEVGCLKTKKIYEDEGYKVIVIDKPALTKGKLHFLLGMMLVPCLLLYKAHKAGKNVPVHIVGFYTKIAWYEKMLMDIAHMMGNKVIYELRNGSMIHTYITGSDYYRETLKSLLLKPEIVLCQGQEYIDFIRNKWGIERSYYPNYIMDEFVKSNNTNRTYPVKLIYFGRVTESKNIDIVIEILNIIHKAGIEATLDVIGGYNKTYKQTLDEKVSYLNMAEYITFYGHQPFDFIAEKLRSSHYFVFPSTEKQEGHSNALTEAMGCGVVPIVSTAGFNVSICGNRDLVVENIDAKQFAQHIINIEKNGKWEEYSNFVYNRVLNNFTQEIVRKKLINDIEKLWI